MVLRHLTLALVVVATAVATGCSATSASSSAPAGVVAGSASLPPVTGALAAKYPMSVTEALAKRRSHRAFESTPLTADELSLLCWSAQGITDALTGHRATPSPRATYTLTVYVVSEKGLSAYVPEGHRLQEIAAGDMKAKLYAAAKQDSFQSAPVVFVIAADLARAKAKMGELAEGAVRLETGHVAENILLQATAMGLAGVPAAGFQPKSVTEALGLPAGQEVLYIVPVGRPK
jgi:SagB-type dehydrogenase family enzyme